MLKRLLVGLILGLVMGSLVAALVVKGLGMLMFPSVLAYLFAGVTGVVTGLVAGKPIWAQGGQIEAGLKAAFGALISVGLMYALRRWVHAWVDLTSFDLGAGTLGQLPATSLPLIAAILGAFYSADNTPSGETDAEGASKVGGKKELVSKKKELASKKMRISATEADESEPEADSLSKRAKR